MGRPRLSITVFDAAGNDVTTQAVQPVYVPPPPQPPPPAPRPLPLPAWIPTLRDGYPTLLLIEQRRGRRHTDCLMTDFDKLRAQLAADDEWRAANPGPLIWVTSLARGAGVMRSFTPGSPEAPFGPTGYHYIGRPMPRAWLEGSALANPFRLGDEGERPEILERYRLWLIEQFHPGTAPWRELGEILVRACDRRGIALGCWCAPKLCHGMIVRDAVLSMYMSGWRPAHFPHAY